MKLSSPQPQQPDDGRTHGIAVAAPRCVALTGWSEFDMSVAMPIADPAVLHAFRAAPAPPAPPPDAEYPAPPEQPAHISAHGSVGDAPAFRSIGANGRLREEAGADVDYTALGMHLSPLAFFWIGPLAFAVPLILWLVRKDHSAFADDHGREVLNFVISLLVLTIALSITIIGIPLVLALYVVGVVNMIRGALAVSRHEYFRYPMTIRFL
jgi:uncharacterized protein